MRIVVLAGLAVGAIAVFAPEQGAGLMRSVVDGFGWGIGREIAHNILAIAIGDGDRGVAWNGGRGRESGPPAADRERQGSALSGH